MKLLGALIKIKKKKKAHNILDLPTQSSPT